MKIFTIFIILLLVIISCGRSTPQGSEWLILAGEDTITAAEAGITWNKLSSRSRLSFTSDHNPVGSFVLAVARNRIVEMEISELDITKLDELQLLWSIDLRNRKVTLFRNLVMKEKQSSITGSDIDFYIEHFGETVWFSEIDGDNDDVTKHGPLHLPDQEERIVELLVSIEPGQSELLPDGSVIRLDSMLICSIPEGIPAAGIDDEDIRLLAAGRIAEAECNRFFNELTDDICAELESSTDSLIMYGFATGLLSENDTVFTTPRGIWTVLRFDIEISFESTLRNTQPENPIWLEQFIIYLDKQEYLADLFDQTYPDIGDSLQLLSERELLKLSSDRLYEMYVTDSISISGTDVEEAFLTEIHPVIILEKRIFRFIFLSEGEELEMLRLYGADSLETSGFLDDLPGINSLSSTPGAQISLPLSHENIPCNRGDELFCISLSDTLSWYGPYPLDEPRGFFLARLAGVQPAHEASFEEAFPILKTRLREGGEQVRFTRWMYDLEKKYELRINERLLRDLPEDPGEWSDL